MREHYADDQVVQDVGLGLDRPASVAPHLQHAFGFAASHHRALDAQRQRLHRDDFQRMMKVRYSAMIEELTGRKVLAFLSQAHVEPDLTIEMFLMDAPLAGFGALELVDLGNG